MPDGLPGAGNSGGQARLQVTHALGKRFAAGDDLGNPFRLAPIRQPFFVAAESIRNAVEGWRPVSAASTLREACPPCAMMAFIKAASRSITWTLERGLSIFHHAELIVHCGKY